MEIVTERYTHPVTKTEGIKAYVPNTDLRAYSFGESTLKLDEEVALAKLKIKVQFAKIVSMVNQVA
jgi:hypothetical protein